MKIKFDKKGSLLYFPPKSGIDELKKVTHVAICAHQDDAEIMAFHGILKCFNSNDEKFLAVVVTDGAGSPKNGAYKNFTNEQMVKTRFLEQKRAARVGGYAAVAFLNYTSAEIKNGNENILRKDIEKLFSLVNPHTVYIHNLLDKHATHVATSLKAIVALQNLPVGQKPKTVYGAEVWRGLDFINDEDKVLLDVSGGEKLALKLLGSFKSQLAGGKRYDLGAVGRWQANATFSNTLKHEVSLIALATDLTDIIYKNKTPQDFVRGLVDRLEIVVSG
jgi:LmbE family N-acetylglucosaminyl deacetylase